MKVVLFCGGQGMRIRDYSSEVPKPMIPVGRQPILWHVMRYYAHFGHKDFILCLGHQAEAIKEYFLEYSEARTNDFVLDRGKVELMGSDMRDWRITFMDTGMESSVGERLMAVRHLLDGEEMFLANYADGLTGAHLPDMIQFAKDRAAVATFLSGKPPYSFHIVHHDHNGEVWEISSVEETGMRINCGWFVLTPEIFDYMEPGDELVTAPFRRLIGESRLAAYAYDGFWACMDTFKEKQLLDDIWRRGDAPWEVWKHHGPQRDGASGSTTLTIPARV